MEELINEAGRLYKNIDDIQLKWVSSTKDSDEEGQRFAIGLMHIAMNSVLQFLKCIIERKDNIVNLGEIWHNGDVVPEEGKQIFVVAKNGFCYAGFYRDYCNKTNIPHRKGVYASGYAYFVLEMEDIAKYVYVEDLLPKGDNK